MTSPRWMLAACFILASVFGTGESMTTTETQKYICRTFGSGVVQPFNGSSFYVRSNCPFTLTHFIHNRVECVINIRRGNSGLLVHVEIIINKIRTVLQNGSILVEQKSVSLPYDHTYQHIFQYGIYTRLRSALIPLSVTWHNVPGGIDILRVELEQELPTDRTGLCGGNSGPGNEQQLITESKLQDDMCQTRDISPVVNQVCVQFFSLAVGCFRDETLFTLCQKNIFLFEQSKYIRCAFFEEIILQCVNSNSWSMWRIVTNCAPPTCPGDLVYKEPGAAFVPSCSNPDHRTSERYTTNSCVCPDGEVLNDRADGFHCVDVMSCPCVFAGLRYSPGEMHSSRCQKCLCVSGKWYCSENSCPPTCVIEGQFVTTFDGKLYVIPGKCTYIASQSHSWTIRIEFSEKEASLETVTLQLFQETYTFTHNRVMFGNQEITELHQSDHAMVFWQSSMYVQVHTTLGLKIQVQVSPKIQLYITPAGNHTGRISGLCGNNNNDTTDDFTTSSGIIEHSAQPFVLSWAVGTCAVNIPTCTNVDYEMFADEKCSVLNTANGIFAKCHAHIPTDQYHTACIQSICNSDSNLQKCLCVALDNYAKACASLGVEVGDWRTATNCTVKCPKNQEFYYDTLSCNRTCRSLSGPDPRCEVEDAPVEGCSCPGGTYLNEDHTCTRQAECNCYYYGGMTPPGPVVVDGRQCFCENGQLRCLDCGCSDGKVCVHCSDYPVNTAQKTCDSLSKPLDAGMTCKSGCYCPHDHYEDHHGNCVPRENCTCVYSGRAFSTGQHVKTNCKTCVCDQGQWHCEDGSCPGRCQVYGNGHYQTFDDKWYRFDGHCQYTLVEDYCGNKDGSFSVTVESVPCCDEALTCSRSIVLDLENEVTLTLSDMRVTKRTHEGWTLQEDSLYTIHTVGLYIIISVPSKGLTLIWDKHTQITIELQTGWRNQVCGLCGNFDSNEMNDLQLSGSTVVSSPLAFGNSWKAATPPCSDVTTEMFPCERHSYCSAWAQRRCMIITGDTFRDCHYKVDPDPYYHACVQESCSCEFEGKFLGFCTAVAAYAEACSDQDVCISWRTPDMCPVYCDYYNEQGQCSWHYEACGKILTCGHDFTHKLEGCYPRCPEELPYYDENTGECTTLKNCSCYFNDTFVQSGKVVMINSMECSCENGSIHCKPSFKTPVLTYTSTPTAYPPPTTTVSSTTTVSTPSTTWSTHTTYIPPTTVTSTTSATMPTPTSTSHYNKTITSTKYTPTTESSTSESSPYTNTSATWTTESETSTAQPTTKYTKTYQPSTTLTATATPTVEIVTGSSVHTTQSSPNTSSQVCWCRDQKRNLTWLCGETWTEDCYNKNCTQGGIVMTPVDCPEITAPTCPRGRSANVSDGCCETMTCDCQCDLFGDPHYITFQGTEFLVMDECTYILVEEQSPRHNLTIIVDTSICMPYLPGSCVESVTLRYQNNIASISAPGLEVTLNNVIIYPPYEEHGLRFETTESMVTIYLPSIRSYVSLSQSYHLVVNLAMEHFLGNTQGQCGVCGGPSCIRRGGQIEDESCCDKTAYDWVYHNPKKPACDTAPRNMSCYPEPTSSPTITPVTPTPCPPNPLCQLLDHQVFANCRGIVNLDLKKKACEFDSCMNLNASCFSLEQAAEECKAAGLCIDWRRLTHGSCVVTCPEGLVYRQCRNKLDDFCYRGQRIPGTSLDKSSQGCFCPSGLMRAGNHSDICVPSCLYCKGPTGEPKWPGEMWESNCNLCTCNNQTQSEQCFPKPPGPAPVCGPNAVLVNTSCCGDQMCVEKTCSYNGKTHKVGDTWKDAAYPCKSFSCSKEGVQTDTRICPMETCPEERRVWDEEHCCFTCNQSCVLRMSRVNVTIDNCASVFTVPVCQGQCVSQPRMVLHGDLQVEQEFRYCQDWSSERRSVTLQCSDLSTRHYVYKHVTSCACGASFNFALRRPDQS